VDNGFRFKIGGVALGLLYSVNALWPWVNPAAHLGSWQGTIVVVCQDSRGLVFVTNARLAPTVRVHPCPHMSALLLFARLVILPTQVHVLQRR
jgi:hypothetical protein